MDDSVFDSRSLIRRAGKLRLASKTFADSMKSGSFRSVYRGQGVEFSGVREYLRGDDVRAIDWNVTARMGKPFVKLFEEERELVLFLIVDASASMLTGSGDSSRIRTACEACALAAFAAEQTGSPVGAVLFDGDIRFSCEPKSGRDQVMLVLSAFDDALASGPSDAAAGSALDKALKGAARLLKKRSLVLVVSDFRVAGYEKPLAVLSAKHDVVAVRITDPLDTDIPEMGCVPFQDPESAAVVQLPTTFTAFRRAWREDGRARVERWQTACVRRGAVPLVMSTAEDPAQSLVRFFAVREGR
ncbi:DUF58 domain-containing protein [Treponema brennaborense]|uniref:DUF58 domain-containing protein n=1 Tax=Treponema brennaborense (strain DSM 12168 / CIP 105900 / DD5/3) TaxID=906968 RepID=F4LK50_TREBD|nr:DUF58 domain-containing protein [Treponema brennaborense]AEE17512.1 protein of unknown function DUF58 [Treponema brennaborense DSM 12168]